MKKGLSRINMDAPSLRHIAHEVVPGTRTVTSCESHGSCGTHEKYFSHLSRATTPCCSSNRRISCLPLVAMIPLYSLIAPGPRPRFQARRRLRCTSVSRIPTIGTCSSDIAPPTKSSRDISSRHTSAKKNIVHGPFGRPDTPRRGGMSDGSIIDKSFGPGHRQDRHSLESACMHLQVSHATYQFGQRLHSAHEAFATLCTCCR